MKTIREEIYDENGFVQVRYIEVEEDIQQLIIEKEQQLLDMYNELQALKMRLENNQ